MREARMILPAALCILGLMTLPVFGQNMPAQAAVKGVEARIQIQGSMNSIVELKDGRGLMLSSNFKFYDSRDGGYTWRTAGPVMTPEFRKFEGMEGEGSSLIRLKSGALALTFPRYNYQGGYALFLVKSYDEGKTWIEETRISPANINPISMSFFFQGCYYGTLIQTQSGRLIQPFRFGISGSHPEWKKDKAYGKINGQQVGVEGHYHVPEQDIAFFYFSDDEGKTWRKSRAFVFGWLNEGLDGMTSCDEPCVAETRDGRILMFARSQVGRIVKSESKDQGESWSMVRSAELASSFSPSRLVRIPKTGDLLCVWNQVSADEIRKGYRRGRLSAAISTDEGKTWKNFKTLEVSDGLDKSPTYKAKLSEAKPVRALDDVGNLAAGYATFSYPNVGFLGDNVLVTYPTSNWTLSEKPTQISSSVLRVIPLAWFYQN